MNTALYSELLSKSPALAGKKKQTNPKGFAELEARSSRREQAGDMLVLVMGGDSCTSTPAPRSPLTPVRLVFTSCKSLPCSQYNPRKIPHTQLTLALFLDGCLEHARVCRGWWGW